MAGPKGIGQIDQICYVTDDIEAAVRQWVDHFGAGPFFLLPNIAFPGWTYLGEPQELHMDLAVGQLGEMQIEFIRPHSAEPSAYSHAMTGGPVLHHYGIIVDDIDMAADRLGKPPVLSTAVSPGGTPFAYLDCRKDYGLVFELIERREDIIATFRLVKEAARDWDGSESLRPLAFG